MKRLIPSLLLLFLFMAASACGKPELEMMTSLEFSKGGYDAHDHQIYIDADNKSIKYGYSELGSLPLDIHETAQDELEPGQEIKEIVLTSEEWDRLLEALTALSIEQWDDSYHDLDIMDGIQWRLTIQFPEDQEMRKGGSNDFPPNWDEFLDVLEKYTGETL
ncbi:hypothetical protein HUG15_19570 [Salicibibacter cibarius]|uniref:Uncharacterized protein n=1 Tax=Salicibibacter cibarius TaxID=2743000 RepID=A0A7T6Z6G7_9BACI|nr:hypothetical protein [Salicibibacter cibarius]QQK77562.1 hypothetical protein HUG15_19570 [Salicibibacter cibarius]